MLAEIFPGLGWACGMIKGDHCKAMAESTQKQTVSLLYFLVFAAMACAGRFSAIFFRPSPLPPAPWCR